MFKCKYKRDLLVLEQVYTEMYLFNFLSLYTKTPLIVLTMWIAIITAIFFY